jgi:hypothetical protein
MQNIQRLRGQAKEIRVREAQQQAREILTQYAYGPLVCECCGFIGLARASIVNGRLVGPECAKPGHRYPCKQKIPLGHPDGHMRKIAETRIDALGAF